MTGWRDWFRRLARPRVDVSAKIALLEKWGRQHARVTLGIETGRAIYPVRVKVLRLEPTEDPIGVVVAESSGGERFYPFGAIHWAERTPGGHRTNW